MNVRINTPLNTGSGMRETSRNNRSPFAERLNRNTVGLPNAVIIDDSLAEILENYRGEKREKRDAEFNPLEAFNSFEDRKAKLDRLLDEQTAHNHWENLRNSGWGSFPPGIRHYLDPNMCQITMNGHDNGLIIVFSHMIQMEMMDNGIESGMALFEQIRADLLENFTGDEAELNARLEALERGFVRAAEQFAQMVADSLMVSSPYYTPEDDTTPLTARQSATNARIQREANNLVAHMGDMFRAALAFFNATGSFAGFFDTAEANQSGRLSMRDVDILSRQTFNNSSGTSHTDRINAQGLSSSGRDALQRFFQIA
ncbi:MAG: hypothetical protein FWB96_02630 [Defluviitaleaceae bacterium]|nr:hypothetical protein [Defluviitaleaceae bacterium]MCL2263863.1 hypothetical protein [Defluviitaleaceae bacterium]